MLWTTKDSGHTYTPVKDLSTDIRNYPADMAFRNKSNGMILTSYHGEELMRILQMMPVKHGLPMKSII